MATLELYLWGCLGGVAMALVVFVLPILTHLTDGSLGRTRLRLGPVVLLVGTLATIAGIVTLTLSDGATRGQAILSGIAAQTFIKGILSTGEDVFTPAK